MSFVRLPVAGRLDLPPWDLRIAGKLEGAAQTTRWMIVVLEQLVALLALDGTSWCRRRHGPEAASMVVVHLSDSRISSLRRRREVLAALARRNSAMPCARKSVRLLVL